MSTFKTGFIGSGNMASAIIGGILNNGLLPSDQLFVYDKDPVQLESLQKGIHRCISVAEVAQKADVLFLCVKPNIVPLVAAEICTPDKAVISIAAGVRIEKLESWIPVPARTMRIMPNTPLMVGEGAVCIQDPSTLTTAEQEFVQTIFSTLGLVEKVNDDQMDAVTAVSGSGPAYVYLFIESLVKAGESLGLPYKTALRLATQTVAGGCKMVQQGAQTPQELIDAVCSPGGTTLEAMKTFEEGKFMQLMVRAVQAAARKSKELSE